MKTKSHLLVLALAVSTVLSTGYALAQKSAGKPSPKHAPDAAPAKPAPAAKPGAAPAASGSAAAPAPTAGHEVVEKESNIEFDERTVKGQTAAGAIYLFQRSPSEFKSIIKVPDSFRYRTTDVLSSRRATP
jgi:hypothetical protein